MPVSIRPRAVRAALVAALAGVAPLVVPLFGHTPARADAGAGQPEAGSQVRFRAGGRLGLGGLLCAADPDQSRLRVEAETLVTFVNYTGRRALLRIDGQDATTVDPNEAVPVVFHVGPVSVSMVPACRLKLNQATLRAVTVAVTPVAPTTNLAAGSSELTFIGDPAAAATGKVSIAPPVPATPAPARANGLAALVAAVCAIGATAGAIRAILTQRVSRTLVA
jgi:hypothetical protein